MVVPYERGADMQKHGLCMKVNHEVTKLCYCGDEVECDCTDSRIGFAVI